MADPRVQQVLLDEQQRMRNKFTLWHDFFSGVEGNLVGMVVDKATVSADVVFRRAAG